MTTLVFSIGPVQSFIAQSRRTADGWVGSYLLSYLAGHAIWALDKAKAEIIEPDRVQVAMYDAIVIQRSDRSLVPNSIEGDTTIAALPNVIVVDTKGHDPNTLGVAAEGSVKEYWDKIQEAIWDRLPQEMKVNAVEEIWKRQVKYCWEFNWAWGKDSKEAFDHLAGRKGLRDFEQFSEEGDRCTVCGQREALWDKNEKRRAKEKQNRDVARRLWREQWQGRIIEVITRAPATLLQLKGKERLCAICLIKRLIPWTTNPIREAWQSRKPVSAQPPVFPSTSTMATVLYRAELLSQVKAKEGLDAIAEYYEVLGKIKKDFTRLADPLDAFKCWKAAAATAKQNGLKEADHIIRIDGDWFLYGEAVKNEYDLKPEDHKTISEAYRAVRGAAEKAGTDSPPIYWALLTMDGDKMGEFIRQVDDAQVSTGKVSAILNAFAHEVQKIIGEHNGRTIFAGGDDVLAFLPFDEALTAADELRRKFAELFKPLGREFPVVKDIAEKRTLSGSIILAHHQAALSAVLKAGHGLLTNVAKKSAGRNALAIQKYMRGGPGLTFAANWTSENLPSLKDQLETVVRELNDSEFSASIFYELRDNKWMFQKDGVFGDLKNEKNPARADAQAYIAALLRKSRLKTKKESEDEKTKRSLRAAEDLLSICLTSVGDGSEKGFTADALLMCRFLAGGGREAH